MLLELGPVPADNVRRWTRLVRRLLVELRANPEELEGIATEDFLTASSHMIDQWFHQTVEKPEADPTESVFRWSQTIEDDAAEYLLHGLERCVCSTTLARLMTEEEIAEHGAFTLHLVESLVDGLIGQGRHCEHYADHVRATVDRVV